MTGSIRRELLNLSIIGNQPHERLLVEDFNHSN